LHSRRAAALWVGIVLLAAPSGEAGGFNPTRDDYYDYIGPTRALGLRPELDPVLGEPLLLYRPNGENGKSTGHDGIEDDRRQRLLKIARRFSPILRVGNFSVPRDFEQMLRLRFDEHTRRIDSERSPILYVDVWNTGETPAQAAPYNIRVDWTRSSSDPAAAQATGDLRELLDALVAESFDDRRDAERRLRIRQQHVQVEEARSMARSSATRIRWRNGASLQEVVPWFDFAGRDESSWRKIYQRLYEQERSSGRKPAVRAYVHAFVDQRPADEARDPKREQRLGLVLQYWLFYPFNDGGNNHEGDWEHINVHVTRDDITPRHRALTRSELESLLQNDTDVERLIVRKVDYYFHHSVVTVDYQPELDAADEADKKTAPDRKGVLDYFQKDEAKFKEQLARFLERRDGGNIGEEWFHKWLHHLIHLSKVPADRPGEPEPFLSQHPVGYIGGEDVTPLVLAASLPGARNQNSHGTYPMPGIWKWVGPTGATERISRENGRPRYLSANEEVLDDASDRRPSPDWVSFSEDELTLLPDPNDVVEAWKTSCDAGACDAELVRKMYWLLLPIRWGFPVANSPLSGMFKRIDLGNGAPLGPAFNPGWNHAGASAYHEYVPHFLPPPLRSGLQEQFVGSYGFLNYVGALSNVPPLNIGAFLYTLRPKALRHVFPRHGDAVPFRFLSFDAAMAYSSGEEEFGHLLPHPTNPTIYAMLSSLQVANVNAVRGHQEGFTGPRFSVATHRGRSGFESDLFLAESRVSYEVDDYTSEQTARVAGRLAFRQFSAGYKQRIGGGALQAFLKGGWSWTSYRISDVTVQNVDSPGNLRVNEVDVPGYRKPWSILPNAWHGAAGLEAYPLGINRQVGFLRNLGQPELGLRLEARIDLQRRVGLDRHTDVARDSETRSWEEERPTQRGSIVAGLVFSF
jgi:hypothetical protein